MQLAGIIVFQLLAMYYMSRQMEKQISYFFYRLSKNTSITMWLMALLFWPGVLIHELSHLIVGRLLLVKTSKLTLIPKMQKNGEIVMGSVQVPTTDRFRFFLIGIAPIYVGVGIILGVLWLADTYQLWGEWMWMIIIGYVVFQVTNNMFLSSSDLHGAFGLLLIISLTFGLCYWLGWRPTFEWVTPWLAEHEAIMRQISNWLWVPVVINASILMMIWVLPMGLRRISK